MTSKTDKSLAYEAGRAAIGEPPERRSVDACPFSPIDHPDERQEWLQGLADALAEQSDLHAELTKALKEESS